MQKPGNHDVILCIINLINNPVVTNPDAVIVLDPLSFFTPFGRGLSSKDKTTGSTRSMIDDWSLERSR
jgi:hypothetical protein